MAKRLDNTNVKNHFFQRFKKLWNENVESGKRMSCNSKCSVYPRTVKKAIQGAQFRSATLLDRGVKVPLSFILEKYVPIKDACTLPCR